MLKLFLHKLYEVACNLTENQLKYHALTPHSLYQLPINAFINNYKQYKHKINCTDRQSDWLIDWFSDWFSDWLIEV